MAISASLRRLIDAAAPYWAGEAEVFRSYWDWSARGRIRMRNAQFGGPLAGDALERALAGRCAPLSFDYRKAGTRLAA